MVLPALGPMVLPLAASQKHKLCSRSTETVSSRSGAPCTWTTLAYILLTTGRHCPSDPERAAAESAERHFRPLFHHGALLASWLRLRHLLLEEPDHHPVRVLEHRECADAGNRHRLDDHLPAELLRLLQTRPEIVDAHVDSHVREYTMRRPQEAAPDAPLGRLDQPVAIDQLLATVQSKSCR
jgi:hypothetical protein